MAQQIPYLQGEVHAVADGDVTVVLDVPTSSLLEFDRAGSLILDAFRKLGHDAAIEHARPLLGESAQVAAREWDALMAQGCFCPEPTMESAPRVVSRGRTIELSATHRCTMRCRYCYSSHDEAGRGTPLDMPHDVVDAAMEWGVREFARDAATLHVTAGATGEGLLALATYDHIRETAARLTEVTGKTITHCIGNTNLTLASVPEVWELLTRGSVDVWSVSIDGPPEIHDRNRRLADDTPSYARIADMARRLLAGGRFLNAQAVITGDQPDLVERFLHLYEMGFRVFAFRPVRARPDAPYAINATTVEAVKRSYSEFGEFLLAQDDPTLLSYLKTIWWEWDFLGRFLRRLAYGVKLTHRCPAGKDVVCVDTDGSIYPCPGMVGVSDLRIGSVYEGIDGEAARVYYEDLYVRRKPTCKECWARYLCGGGCYHAAYLVNGRVDVPDPYDCELMRHLVELAMVLTARLQRERPSVFHALPHPFRGVVNTSAVLDCSPTDRPLALTGPLEPWRSSTPARFERADQARGWIWGGASEASGEVHLRWDAGALYLMAYVRGSKPLRETGGPALGVCLAPYADQAWLPDPEAWMEEYDNHVIRFLAGQRRVSVLSGRDGPGRSRAMVELPASVSVEREGTRVRVVIPWSALYLLSPRPGTRLAFNTFLCGDGTNRMLDLMRWLPRHAAGILRLCP